MNRERRIGKKKDYGISLSVRRTKIKKVLRRGKVFVKRVPSMKPLKKLTARLTVAQLNKRMKKLEISNRSGLKRDREYDYNLVSNRKRRKKELERGNKAITDVMNRSRVTFAQVSEAFGKPIKSVNDFGDVVNKTEME